MLRIWLFGSLSAAVSPIDAHSDGSSQAEPVPGRCGSLLAFLALGRGRLFSRSELLETLWHECSGGTSAGSFNTALWRLRKRVERPPHRHGELISSDRRGGIGLCSGNSVWLDIEEFEHRIQPGLSKPIEQLEHAEIEDLATGVGLYKADILTDFSDDWALRERERHRRHYLNALWRLMQLASIRRDFAGAIGFAQSILDCDSLREDVHRELMKLFVQSGQRAQALRQFERCRDLLRQELAILPMRETLALYQQIADSAIGHQPAALEPMPGASSLAPAVGVAPDANTGASPRRMFTLARQHLALADAQLELGLEQLKH